MKLLPIFWSGLKLIHDYPLEWTLVLAIPAVILPGLFPLTFLYFLAILFTVPWVLRTLSSTGKQKVYFYEGAALLFLVSHLSGCVLTADVRLTMEKVLQSLTGVGLFFSLTKSGISDRKVIRILYFMTLGIAFLILAAPLITVWPWYTKFFYFDYFQSFYALAGKFPWKIRSSINPNILSGLLAFLLPIALSLGLYFRRSRQKNRPLIPAEQVTLSLCIVLFLSGVILFQSRSALMGIGASLFLFLFILFRKIRIPAVSLLMGVLILGLLFNDRVPLFDWIGSSIRSAFQVRTELWRRALTIVQAFPLTGVGFGMFPWASEHIFGFYDINYHVPNGTLTHAHQMFLQIPVDLGLPGLIAWISLLGYLFSIPSHREEGKELYLLRFGIQAGLVAMLVGGITDCPLWGTRISPFSWFAMGSLIVLSKESIQETVCSWKRVFCLWTSLLTTSFFLAKVNILVAVLVAIAGSFLIGIGESPSCSRKP